MNLTCSGPLTAAVELAWVRLVGSEVAGWNSRSMKAGILSLYLSLHAQIKERLLHRMEGTNASD